MAIAIGKTSRRSGGSLVPFPQAELLPWLGPWKMVPVFLFLTTERETRKGSFVFYYFLQFL